MALTKMTNVHVQDVPRRWFAIDADGGLRRGRRGFCNFRNFR